MEDNKGVKTEKSVVMDELAHEKITRFLAPKRRGAVFSTLSGGRELSQGDLAKAVDSTATALSNLLSKFEKFEYKLLEVENVGRYRYYKLSEVGRAYLEAVGGPAEAETGSGEDRAIVQEAKEHLDAFKELYSDGWKTCFNGVMMRLIYGRGGELDEEGERLVSRYLRCVELLSLQSSPILSKALEELGDDILRDDVEKFMENFEPFTAVLNTLMQGMEPLAVYMIVKAAFCTEEEKAPEAYMEAIGWKGGRYDELRRTAEKLKVCVSGYGEEEIYRYFNRLLPDQGQLSLYIARCICGGR